MADKPTYEELEKRISDLEKEASDERLKQEIEEYKQVVKAFKKSQLEISTILNNAPFMMIMLDRHRRVRKVNNAVVEFTARKEDEMIGLQGGEALRCVHHVDHPKGCGFGPACQKCPLRFAVLDTFKTQKSYHNVEANLLLLEGERISEKTIIFSTVSLQILDDSVLICIEDITEQKHLEGQFQQAQKLESIGTLAGGIAHGFNNLLMCIQGNISLMLLNIDSTHPFYERLKNVEEQVKRGARLTSHLLGYARKGKYEIKPINLNQLLEKTLETFARTRKEITIHRNFAQDLFIIEADQSQISQVLLNIFVNASDAMHRGGNLNLRTDNVTHNDMKGELYNPKLGNYVLLTVSDTGAGMDKKTMKRIFDPFFTTKEIGQGTGLELASAYGIVKAHRGYIEVESEKGQGTTFSIYLPASDKKVQQSRNTE